MVGIEDILSRLRQPSKSMLDVRKNDTTGTISATDPYVQATELAKKVASGLPAMDDATRNDYTQVLSIKAAADSITDVSPGQGMVRRYVDNNSGLSMESTEAPTVEVHKLNSGNTVRVDKDINGTVTKVSSSKTQ